MNKILSSEITPYNIYLNRRNFLKTSMLASVSTLLSTNAFSFHQKINNQYDVQLDEGDTLNTYEEITTYNNFY